MNREALVCLSLPKFDNELQGSLVLAVVRTGSNTTTITYGTTDRGVTWAKVGSRSWVTSITPKAGTNSRDPLMVQVQAGANLYTTHVAGSAKIFALPKKLINPSVLGASFTDAQTGWIVVRSTSCAAAGVECTQSDALMLTTDAGATYSDVTPIKPSSPKAAGQSVASPDVIVPIYSAQAAYMAWDQQVVPSYAQRCEIITELPRTCLVDGHYATGLFPSRSAAKANVQTLFGAWEYLSNGGLRCTIKNNFLSIILN